MKSIKDFLVDYGVVLGSRYSKKEKGLFLQSIRRYCSDNQFNMKEEIYMGANHISIKASDNPSLILLVPYDTPAISYDGNLDYYLNDQDFLLKRKKRSIRNKVFLEMIQILILGIISLLTFRSVSFFRYIGIVLIAIFSIYYLISRKERSFKTNMNFNSAAVALSLSLIIKDSLVSVILIDDYYKNAKWKDFLAKNRINEKKNVILLESLSGKGDFIISKSKCDSFVYNDNFIQVESDTFYSILNIAYKDKNGVRTELKSFNSDYEVDVKRLEELECLLLQRMEELK